MRLKRLPDNNGSTIFEPLQFRPQGRKVVSALFGCPKKSLILGGQKATG
jgi:hypothetical protein